MAQKGYSFFSACNACTPDHAGTGEYVLRISKQICQNVSVLVTYMIVSAGILGCIVFLINDMVDSWRQWRVISTQANPVSKYMAGTYVSGGDDEVYQADVDNPVDTTIPLGHKIADGMKRLEQRYSAYNQQITNYSKNVLHVKEPDDLVDRNVMDRSKDDFNHDILRKVDYSGKAQ
ncbi:hypothetical protein HYH03_017289 [Edaphochlamys debaryana]|uniref:Uncharacterized protein n=1 Tax=Edaphochlamys debaryana TaxID=47281 RepID=A0A836BPB1_9CHLO|nr:hypothetical protein HYH03_017289 [Edaphochlamys debaryana]|eukprot:KAG2483895.1 hypothetical protein HYH03_017289 [Edaphochlamys debaryana]